MILTAHQPVYIPWLGLFQKIQSADLFCFFDIVQYQKKDMLVSQGDLLIMHGNLIHGSYPNVSKRRRPLLSMSYITKGEQFIEGNTAKRTEIELH